MKIKIVNIHCPYCWKLVINPFNVFLTHCENMVTGEKYIELWHKDCAKLYAEEMENDD